MVLAVASCVLLVVTLASRPGPSAKPCDFEVSRPTAPARIVGPEEVTRRVRLISQPDSPVVFTTADFTGTNLTVAPGFFQWNPNHRIEIMNVSDQWLTDVRAMVFVRSGEGSGVGSGSGKLGPLAPGARITFSANGGPGSGGVKDDVSVDLFIETLKIGGCTYHPSRRVPSEPSGER